MVRLMKHIIASVLALSLTVSPALAQDAEVEEGFDLMEEGTKLMLRGLMREMEPAMRELEGMANEIGPAMRELGREMGPAIAELMSKIDDIRNYDAPEILPNGDIIIRRRSEAPEFDGEEIEL